MSSKKIIHQKIPLDKYGRQLIDVDVARVFHDHLQVKLGEEYLVITCPTDLRCVVGDDKIVMIDCKEYSYNELIEIIGKSER